MIDSMNNNVLNTKKRKVFPLLLALVAVAALGSGAWWFITQKDAQAQEASEKSNYQTTSVRRGDLSISITGTGTVMSTRSVELGFAVSGTIAELNVQVGDQVTQGQVLAVLGNLDVLQLAVQNQELAVAKAQKTIDGLSDTEVVLAQAYADQAAAQSAYEEAKKAVHYRGDSRCAPSLTQEYYFQSLYAQQAVDEWEGYLAEGNTGYSQNYILEKLAPLRKTRNQAAANYKYCQSYTEQEILTSQAALTLTKANLDQAIQNYENLKATGGIDADALEIARAELKNAQLQLTKAQKNLAGATIIAPMAGTVMDVNGAVEDAAGSGTLITLSDLNDPELQVTIDESDLSNFAVGCATQVTFDSIPNTSFSGVVSEVSPSLTTSAGLKKVQGKVELQRDASTSTITLPVGLTASIEVTCLENDDVLIVASQALHEVDGSPTTVYVLNDLGQPEKREVEVGLKTVANAEILSGLEEGDKVLLSQVEGE